MSISHTIPRILAFYRLLLCPSHRRLPEISRLIALVVSLIIRARLSIWLTELMGSNARALVGLDFHRFGLGVLKMAAIAVPASALSSGIRYATTSLAVRFREILTAHIHRVAIRPFVLAQVAHASGDNPHERTTSDVESASRHLAELVPAVLSPLIHAAVFTNRLARDVGLSGPLILAFYYAVSGVVVRGALGSFSRSASAKDRLERDYARELARLSRHAEQIAFYRRGPAREAANLQSLLRLAHAQGLSHLRRQSVIEVLDAWLVKYGATMTGHVIVALPVFFGGGPSLGDADITQSYVQNTQILVRLSRASGQLVLLGRRLAELGIALRRIEEVLEASERAEMLAKSQPIVWDADRIELDHVWAVANAFGDPEAQDPLLRDLSVRVDRGGTLIVTGETASGKSSVLRALNGQILVVGGRVRRPPPHNIRFLPQQTYFPDGTLGEQISYPEIGAPDQDRLLRALRGVQLEYLLHREGGWEATKNWADVLSGGEKQRLCFARLFYRITPFVCLDECTSAIAPDGEAELYRQLLQGGGETVLRVSPRGGGGRQLRMVRGGHVARAEEEERHGTDDVMVTRSSESVMRRL